MENLKDQEIKDEKAITSKEVSLWGKVTVNNNEKTISYKIFMIMKLILKNKAIK